MKASKPVVSIRAEPKQPQTNCSLGQTRIARVMSDDRGQALAELIIACAILIILLMGVVTTINFALRSSSVALNKTLASHYAAQLIEQARGARNESSAALTTFKGPLTSYQPIANSIFQRRITIVDTSPSSNLSHVTAEVRWFDGTQEYTTSIVTLVRD